MKAGARRCSFRLVCQAGARGSVIPPPFVHLLVHARRHEQRRVSGRQKQVPVGANGGHLHSAGGALGPRNRRALDRHRAGGWGDAGKEDWQANERALKQAERLLSVYHTADGTKFWIITEWDRSLSTVLLPEDY